MTQESQKINDRELNMKDNRQEQRDKVQCTNMTEEQTMTDQIMRKKEKK